MKFTANKKYVFYPDINGNRGLPEGERLSVEIIRPTAEERGEVSWWEGNSRKDKDTFVRARYDTARILRRNVGAVKNLTVEYPDSPGKEIIIATGEELAAASFAGMNALVDAICAEVCADTLSESQKKTCVSGSGLSSTDGRDAN